MTNRNKLSAFTLRDLIVLLIALPLVGVGCLGSMCRSTETANRVKCASNLRQIGQALLLYQNDNKGQYPRTIGTSGAEVTPCWGTGAEAKDPFGPGGPAPNDITASLFLLLRTQDITSEVFTCPSGNEEKWDFGGGRKTALDWSNWPKELVSKHLSYSFQNQYPDDAAAKTMTSSDYTFKPPTYENFAVAADMNPGVVKNQVNLLTVTSTSSAKDTKFANSRNHDNDGQNVLYGDGHVDFQQNPFVGVNRDNIYARRASSTGFASAPEPLERSPYDKDDSVLLPYAQ